MFANKSVQLLSALCGFVLAIFAVKQLNKKLSMNIETHQLNDIRIAEVISDVVIKTTEDGLDLVGNLYYQDFDCIILHKKNSTPDFFDLKSRIAGEILQKFSNYRVRLAIVGDEAV